MTRPYRMGPTRTAWARAHEERRQEITSRILAGESISKIAADLNISHQRVSQISHKQGVRIGTSRTLVRQREERNDLVSLAREGYTLDEIATRTGRPKSSIASSVRRVGIRFARQPRVEQHGTRYEYGRGCRCEPCRAANTKSVREWMRGPGKGRQTARVRARESAHPDRRPAYSKVSAAVAAGKLVAPDRCSCGRQGRLHAHHDDYSKPLDIQWLCAVCHKALHASLKRKGTN